IETALQKVLGPFQKAAFSVPTGVPESPPELLITVALNCAAKVLQGLCKGLVSGRLVDLRREVYPERPHPKHDRDQGPKIHLNLMGCPVAPLRPRVMRRHLDEDIRHAVIRQRLVDLTRPQVI